MPATEVGARLSARVVRARRPSSSPNPVVVVLGRPVADAAADTAGDQGRQRPPRPAARHAAWARLGLRQGWWRRPTECPTAAAVRVRGNGGRRRRPGHAEAASRSRAARRVPVRPPRPRRNRCVRRPGGRARRPAANAAVGCVGGLRRRCGTGAGARSSGSCPPARAVRTAAGGYGSALVLGAHSSSPRSTAVPADSHRHCCLYAVSFSHGRQGTVSAFLCVRCHPLRRAKPTHPLRRPHAPRERWHHDAVTLSHAQQPIQVVAHRGASEDAPEHTLAAYRRAIEDGADALECDVRLTADGHLVCVHDRRVNRTSNGRGAVSALELADLAALDFGSWKNERSRRRTSTEGPDGGHLRPDPGAAAGTGRRRGPPRGAGHRDQAPHPLGRPGRGTPADAARAVRPGRPDRAPDAPSPVRVMSFSARSLHRVQAAAPAPADRLPDAVRLAAAPRRPAARRVPHRRPGHPDRARHPGYVERLQRAGHQVHVWTVNEPEDVDCASARRRRDHHEPAPSRCCTSSEGAKSGHHPHRECTGAFGSVFDRYECVTERGLAGFRSSPLGHSPRGVGQRRSRGWRWWWHRRCRRRRAWPYPMVLRAWARRGAGCVISCARRGLGSGRRRRGTDPFRTAEQRLPARRPLGDDMAGDGDVRAAWRVDARGCLTVEVTDGGGPTRPLPATPSVTARGGRGLNIIRRSPTTGAYGTTPPAKSPSGWSCTRTCAPKPKRRGSGDFATRVASRAPAGMSDLDFADAFERLWAETRSGPATRPVPRPRPYERLGSRPYVREP